MAEPIPAAPPRPGPPRAGSPRPGSPCPDPGARDPGARDPGATFLPWSAAADGPALGHLSLPLARALCQAGLMRDAGFGLVLAGGGYDRHDGGPETLSARLEAVRARLAARGLIPPWRDEPVHLRPEPQLAPVATVDRSLVRPFGMWLGKVHVVGVLDRGLRTERIWLAQRSAAARSAPGEWDTLVAGGQSAADSVHQAALREGAEEAGLTPALCRGLRLWHRSAAIYQTPLGLHREMLWGFDLDLPAGFRPVCGDGEIQGFALLSRRELGAALRGGRAVKHASGLILDRWLRQGAGGAVFGPE